MTAPAVVRDDLSRRDPRERISKSFVRLTETCGERAWRSIHDPRPWTPPEKVSFGSAVDTGVEVIITYLRAGQAPDMSRALAAAMERVHLDPNPPERDEVWEALDAFYTWPVVRDDHDFAFCATQPHIRLELPGIGEVDAHPDLILAQPFDLGEKVVDIKTGKVSKPVTAAATSFTELGFYALLREAETGHRVGSVAYWTWVRSRKPYWQEVAAPVTDHMLTVARHRVAAVARALEADALLNDGMAIPTNSVFVSPPRYGCTDCEHHPAAGGGCEVAEEITDVAA